MTVRPKICFPSYSFPGSCLH